MRATIAILPGDGIGPDVAAEAAKVLYAIGQRFHHHFVFHEALIGGIGIDQHADPFPESTRLLVADADAVLVGAVGGARWSDAAATMRPEDGVLALRTLLGVYANLRPVTVHPALVAKSPLKAAYLTDVDILFVRELGGGAFSGARILERDDKGRSATASDLCAYTATEVERVVRVAAAAARGRRGRLTSVDKADVMASSRLWREVTTRIVHDEFPEVTLEHALADTFAMQLLQAPGRYDVVVTDNLFGDLLNAEAVVLAGSIGVLPSASLGDARHNGRRRGLYQPIQSATPQAIAPGIANPAGAILSAALLLRYSLGLELEAAIVERAVFDVIASGRCTADCTEDGTTALSTIEFGDAVLALLDEDKG